MKITFRKNYGAGPILIFVCLSVMLMVPAGCDKEEDYGVPRITNIRTTDPDQADISLNTGNMGQMIVIQGENLASTQRVSFNELEAFINPSLVTNTNVIIRIPGDFPEVITDEIHLITLGGETTYPFEVNIPAPVASGFPLEWVPEGGILTIDGDYFVNVVSIEFTGGVTTTGFETISPKKLEVIVPEGAGSGPVTVHAVAGSATTRAHFRDSRNMMINFDNLPICWGGDAFVVNANNIPENVPVESISGNFYYMKQNYSAGTWWIQESVIAYCGGVTVSGNIADWALAFEMWVGDAWNKNWFEINMHGSSQVFAVWKGYETLGGESKTLENTGWFTVKIPLASLKNEQGVGLSGDTFRMEWWGSYKAQLADTFEFAFDNFRLVPLN